MNAFSNTDSTLSTKPIVCANCGAVLEEYGEIVPGATPVDDKWYCGGACDI